MEIGTPLRPDASEQPTDALLRLLVLVKISEASQVLDTRCLIKYFSNKKELRAVRKALRKVLRKLKKI